MTMAIAPESPMAPSADAPVPEPRVPMGTIAACVAILCGVLLAALAYALWRRQPSRLFAALRWASAAGFVRGPPTIPIGLALSSLSVSRN